MPDAAVLAPFALAAVLLLSGVAKLRDAESTRSVVQELRLPRWLWGRWFALALPVGELILAVCLLIPWPGLFVVASIAALLLCLAYWVVIARAMRFDPRPDCGCFGRIGDQRVSGRTLVRNSVLVVFAAVAMALASSGSTVGSRLIAPDTGWWLVGVVAVAALTVLILTPASGRPEPAASTATGPAELSGHLADDDLEYVRTPIPAGTLARLDGTIVTLAELVAQRPQLLIAVNCTCGSTREAMENLKGFQDLLPQVDVRLVTTIDRKRLAAIDQDQADESLYDHHAIVWTALGLGARRQQCCSAPMASWRAGPCPATPT